MEVRFNQAFAREFKNLPQQDQDKILDFIDLVEASGLDDFSVFEGKIAQSWSGDCTQAAFEFAQENSLWHYHIGIPDYEARHGKYKTSDYVLHFQWPDHGNTIMIADLNFHYDSSGKFYLPSETYLE